MNPDQVYALVWAVGILVVCIGYALIDRMDR